ncbi:uncharacterized protein [Macaca nemestrina]|uniref:uncharacterized protein isoform X1 n=1 Tax=Macaca nemestrina TaxID=9545 RepID=UPI0039B89753
MQDIPEDRESQEVRWHFSTTLEPMPRNSKGCAASPWLTQWLYPRGPQGLGRLYGGEGGPEGACGETRASIHPPLGTDTIRKYTSQGAVPKMWHLERRTSSGWPRTRRCKSSWLSLTDSVEPAPGEAREGSPHHNPTAQQIVQLLPLTQDSPGAPRLGQQPLHAILFTVPRSGR